HHLRGPGRPDAGCRGEFQRPRAPGGDPRPRHRRRPADLCGPCARRPAGAVPRAGDLMAAPVLRHLPELVSLVFGAAAWELLGRFLQQPALPPLSTVLSAMWALAQQGEFRVFEDSLRHLVIAVSLALVAG